MTVSDVVENSTVTVTGLSDDDTPENVPWASGAPSATGAIGAVTWSKAGVDAGVFRIDSRTGVLTLPAQDFENPADDDVDNAYDITVRATDSDSNEGEAAITVRVTNSAETSTVTIEGLSNDSIPENVAWTSPAPIARGAIGAVSWDKEGPDADAFDIDLSSGILTLSARNYEDPTDIDGDNVYAVTVKATDSDNNADVQPIDVRVTDLQEVSTVRVSGLSDALVSENEPWTSAMPEATGGIGSVTWSRSGQDANHFTIDEDSGVMRLSARDYENPSDLNRDNVYEVTAKATDEDENEGESLVRVTVMDVDDAPGTPPPSTTPPPGSGGGGGGGGGGSANRPPVIESQIENQVLDAGAALELDVRLNFYDRDQRALDYTVASPDPDIAEVEVDRNGVITIRGRRRGVTAVTVTAADRREESVAQTFLVRVAGPALVALFPSASDALREGFVRIVNHEAADGEIAIAAIDDGGAAAGPVTLAIDAGAVVHFNSGDLEDGNAAKGLPDGVGQGEGDWRLVLESELDFEVLTYIRTWDGFLTAMHDTVPNRDGSRRVAIFNPGSNADQVSRLRLVNPGDEAAAVTIAGVDDAGASPGTGVEVEIPAGDALTLTASELESGAGLDGALGDGVGKWRLAVTADRPIVAMSLLSSPTGHLTNLSTVPPQPDDGRHRVPLFPAASDALGRQGFVRVRNRSAEAGAVTIEAHDDSEWVYEALTLAIGGGETVHFNSDDLELGNAVKGLTGSTGAGVGDWRLVLSSDLDLAVAAYIRNGDGFLTSMHEVAPSADGRHWVAIVNPGSNADQVSRLRLANPGDEDAAVTIGGVDDAGASPGTSVVLTVPAGASKTLTSAELESGGEDFTGALGDGVGKWRVTVTSDVPIVVMSLLSSPTGHLTNLSTAPDRGPY